MSDRNELPAGDFNLPPGCSNNDPYFTDEAVSICPGYGVDCNNEKDYETDLCDECHDAADLEAKEEAEARALREGEPVEELPYPHLTDRE